ncbi:MAG: hypothetical protein ACREJB_16890, partial [Planctomycetaceae bacterium]
SKGFSLAVAVPGEQGPPLPSAILIAHQAGDLEPSLSAIVKQATEGQATWNTRDVQGRSVTSTLIPLGNGPEIELAWWAEGTHLVVAAGFDPVGMTLAVAEGESENITTNPLWKKYRDGQQEFEVAGMTWIDLGAVRRIAGSFPIGGQSGPGEDADREPRQITVNDALQAVGFDQVGAIVGRTGYKGRATWSTTTFEAPAPRSGLLALADQQPITFDDLPPLPFGTNGFYACSVDWSKSYGTVLEVVKEAVKLGPPEQAAQVEQMIAAIPDIIGFDPKSELFDGLGNVICLYGDTRQGPLGIGVGLAIEVKDPELVRRTLDEQLGQIVEQADPKDVALHRANKHGRDIVTLEIAGGLFNPSFVVDEEWMVIGLMPQTCEAFLLRVDGELTTWEPTATYREALDELPKEYVSICASDPRKTYRTLVGLAPIILPLIKLGLRESNIPQLEDLDVPVHLSDLPPAEIVGKKLFPNVSVCTVDDQGIHCTSRISLPAIPLLGNANGATGLAVAGVGVALLLPAIQQA